MRTWHRKRASHTPDSRATWSHTLDNEAYLLNGCLTYFTSNLSVKVGLFSDFLNLIFFVCVGWGTSGG